MSASQGQTVQIHYVQERSHWVTSSSTRLRVELADSLQTRDSITPTLSQQLLQKYQHLICNNNLEVHIIPVMQQTNGIDCGLFAIANAVEFLTENGNPLQMHV